ISLTVSLQFWKPEVKSRFRKSCEPASRTCMPMPKASVHEDHHSASSEYQIWPSRQFATMQSISVTELGNQSPDDFLRGGVTAADTTHTLAALLACECVHLRLEPDDSLRAETTRGVFHHSPCRVLAKTADGAQQHSSVRTTTAVERAFVQRHQNGFPG